MYSIDNQQYMQFLKSMFKFKIRVYKSLFLYKELN
jgi:hypothetical protein